MSAPTVGLDTAERIAALEDMFVMHWSHFGRHPGGSLHDADGVLWFETPIAHLPYNAVIRARLADGADADAVVAAVTARFRDRDVPFMWVLQPGDTPGDLGHRLAAGGLDLVERATGMDLDLAGWQPAAMPPGVEVVECADDDQLRDYETLIRTYWSVPDGAREQIEALNRYWSGPRNPGARFVAYADGEPVGKLMLNLLGLPHAGIFGVAVVPAARGRGIASALMTVALGHAAERGATRALLHSSPMAVSLYRRMGFVERCPFDAYATGPIFGTHHH